LSDDIRRHPRAPLVPGRRYRDRVRIGCYYCGGRHTHGTFGHKRPHCPTFTDTRGFERDIGYIVVPAALLPQLMRVWRAVQKGTG
jgi:hypothetical protein